MPSVTIERSMPLAPASAWHAVRSALETFAERSVEGGVSLTAIARSGDEELARLSVPVRLEVPTSGLVEGGELPLRIHARTHQGAFPTFDGRVTIDTLDQADARVRLVGAYALPGNVLTGVAAALPLETLAEDSLRRFLDDLVAASLQSVRDDTDARYREMRRGVV